MRNGCHNPSSWLLGVSLVDVLHDGEDGVPGLLLLQRAVGEHASIPAEVLDFRAWIAVFIE